MRRMGRIFTLERICYFSTMNLSRGKVGRFMVIIKLWEIRTAKGLKLEAVAAVTGVSKSTLNNIENGKTSPTLANLEKIAKGLGCRISDLYESEYK